MIYLWAALVIVGAIAEAWAMIRILSGADDRTFSAWVRAHVPAWLVVAAAGWFVVHVVGPQQDTRAALLTLLATVAVAWAVMRVTGAK